MRNYPSRFTSRFTQYETETQNRGKNNPETKAVLEKEEKEKENGDWRSILNKLNASIKQVDSLPKDPPPSPKENLRCTFSCYKVLIAFAHTRMSNS